MNAIGIALVWCAVQVTLLALLASVLYAAIRRFRPAAGLPVVLAGLGMVVFLTLLALSPWPRWADGFISPADSPAETTSAPMIGVAAEPAAPPNSQQPPAGKAAPSAAGPSFTATFWQLLRDGLSQPKTEATGSGWRWQATAGWMLIAAMMLGLTWLMLGVAAVRRERHRGRTVHDAELAELIDVICAELHCLRKIEVRQCDGLATAATVGWGRPVILLPADWPHWTAAQRRAVLAHEIAHIRNRDFPTMLFGQIGLVLHYYHPLVHWLMGRLRLEQELAADAAAAGICGGQRNYLVTIAEIALGRQERSTPWPARAFLPTQTTFLRRIAVLRDSKLRFDRLSPAARLAAVGIVLLCGLLVAGLRGPVGPSPAWAEDAAAEKPSAAIAEKDSAAIDLSFVPATAQGVIVIRPAEAVRRPELAPLVKLLEESGTAVPQGTRLADFRQIICVFIPIEMHGSVQQLIIYQSFNPLDASSRSLSPLGQNFRIDKELDGKRMYLSNSRHVALQYDDRTIIFAFAEKVIERYLKAKRGVLPQWLPLDTWKSFEKDHVVIAGDMASIRRGMNRPITGGGPPAIDVLSAFSPLYENTTSILGGLRIDDKAFVHAGVLAKDDASAENVKKAVEAVFALVQANISLQTYGEITGEKPPKEDPQTARMLDLVKSLLANLKIEREGVQISAQSSVGISLLQRFLPAVAAARQAAQNVQSQNNLRQLAIAMHNYLDAKKHFPPAVLYGPDGKTPYSWRVALLPYLGYSALYKQYRFDEPWDSPNNRKLLTQMPAVYRCPMEPAGSQNTCYFVLTGPGTLFDGKKETAPKDVRDGFSYTLMLVEAKRGIPWTKPEDIPYNPDQPLPKLGGFFKGKINIAYADGSVWYLPDSIGEKMLRALITKDGKEVVKREEIGENK
jgi:prepilin-type processing-associated H-X9-DG protein